MNSGETIDLRFKAWQGLTDSNSTPALSGPEIRFDDKGTCMDRHITYDGAEPVRVNKWLAQSGICSRREAEALILQGQVSIDGNTVNDPGHKILPGQSLSLAATGGAALEARLSLIYHKPIGIVSGQPEQGEIPAMRMITRANLIGHCDPMPGPQTRLAPVGRLDKDSRGLLILSEDGVLTKAVIGPESDLDKEYFVRIRGEISEAAIGQLRHGLELDGRALKPAIVTRMGAQTLKFILSEGRNRQIRRMCDLVGVRVIDLKRERIGPLQLGSLPEGRWRILTAEERAALIRDSVPRHTP